MIIYSSRSLFRVYTVYTTLNWLTINVPGRTWFTNFLCTPFVQRVQHPCTVDFNTPGMIWDGDNKDVL